MKANGAETYKSYSSADIIKWCITFVLLVAAVVGNFLYGDASVVIRVAGVIVLGALALAVAASTAKGKVAIQFAKESRMEIRKVVWPTPTEARQTTLIVLAVSIVMALVLWGIDGVMVRIINFITGI